MSMFKNVTVAAALAGGIMAGALGAAGSASAATGGADQRVVSQSGDNNVRWAPRGQALGAEMPFMAEPGTKAGGFRTGNNGWNSWESRKSFWIN